MSVLIRIGVGLNLARHFSTATRHLYKLTRPGELSNDTPAVRTNHCSGGAPTRLLRQFCDNGGLRAFSRTAAGRSSGLWRAAPRDGRHRGFGLGSVGHVLVGGSPHRLLDFLERLSEVGVIRRGVTKRLVGDSDHVSLLRKMRIFAISSVILKRHDRRVRGDCMCVNAPSAAYSTARPADRKLGDAYVGPISSPCPACCPASSAICSPASNPNTAAFINPPR